MAKGIKYDETMLDWKALQWTVWLEEGKLIEVTRHARRIGITCKVAVTSGLFNELAPFSEEATKGHTLDERLDDMLNEFHKHKRYAKDDYVEFDVKMRHMVKDAKDLLNPEVYKSNRDKKITVVAGRLVDDNAYPAIVFALKR